MSLDSDGVPSIHDIQAALSKIGTMIPLPLEEVIKEYPVADESYLAGLDRDLPGWRATTLHEFMLHCRELENLNDAPDVVNTTFEDGINPFHVLLDIYDKS